MVLLVWLHVFAAVSSHAVPHGGLGIDCHALTHGALLLHERGILIMSPAGWPMVLSVKLGLVAILLLFTVTHDLIIGPRVGRILQISTESRTSSACAMVAWSPWIARCSLLLTLAVLLAAVVRVRT